MERLLTERMKLVAPYEGDGIEYLDRALPYLATYNEYGWEDIPPFEDIAPGLTSFTLNWYARDVLTKRFAWAVPDEHSLQTIAALSPIVEVGAGSGYWAKELRTRGAKVAAYDIAPYPIFNMRRHAQVSYSHYPIAKGSSEKAMRHYGERTLFLCWPSLGMNWAAQAVRRHRGEYVAYVGEGLGGCTGDDELHILLELLYEEISCHRIPRWWGVRDWLTIYKRKADLTPEMAIEVELALHAHADRYGLDDD